MGPTIDSDIHKCSACDSWFGRSVAALTNFRREHYTHVRVGLPRRKLGDKDDTANMNALACLYVKPAWMRTDNAVCDFAKEDPGHVTLFKWYMALLDVPAVMFEDFYASSFH